MTPDFVQLGTFAFSYIPDGDDPAQGWLRIVHHQDTLTAVQTTRQEWQQFVKAAHR